MLQMEGPVLNVEDRSSMKVAVVYAMSVVTRSAHDES
jgi:hypothetical protein